MTTPIPFRGTTLAARVWSALGRWRARTQTSRQLGLLNNAQLADIGIDRSRIPEVAAGLALRGGAYPPAVVTRLPTLGTEQVDPNRRRRAA